MVGKRPCCFAASERCRQQAGLHVYGFARSKADQQQTVHPSCQKFLRLVLVRCKCRRFRLGEAMPPQSIPVEPPITLQIGFPVADIPGCVETRNSGAGDKEIYNTDPKGNITVCGGQMPSYKPIDYTPGTLTYGAAKPPPPPEEPEAEPKKEKPAGELKPTDSPSSVRSWHS